MSRRVVVTGMGMLSAGGATLSEARPKLLNGTCCLTLIQDERAERLKARYAGQVACFDVLGTNSTTTRQGDKHIMMALKAAQEALTSAGLKPPELGSRMGLVFATCSGPMLLIERHYQRILAGTTELSTEELVAKRYYSGAATLCEALGIAGGFFTVVTACSAGTAAIALAADLIRCGVLDCALAGGSDALAISTLAGFDGLKATSDGKCAPFSKPFGLNLGEAAAFVVVEEAARAATRRASIHATILGSGSSNDAHHCSAPDPTGRGLSLAMQRALRNAGLSTEAIRYVNAHGTGTEANDKAECKALRKVFGETVDRLPVSSTKSILGHCLGAAGSIEAIASIVCAEAGVFPPTANYSGPRDGCSVDCVADTGRPWSGEKTFMSNNSAFGGHNASIVLQASPEPVASRPIETTAESICITGIGVVSSLGIGWRALVDGVLQGRHGLQNVNLEGATTLKAGMVDSDAVEKAERRLDLRSMDRSSRWSTLASFLAIRDSGMPERGAGLTDLGVFLNLSAGPSWAESEYLQSYLRTNQVSQLSAFPYIVPSSVAGNVCRELRLMGHNLTLSLGPGAGLLGLVPAMSALQTGHANAVLCGAVDELTERILADNLHSSFSLGEPAQPFGEGSVMLMLEKQSHARERGAQPIASIRAVRCGSGAWHDEQLVQELIAGLLAEAKVKASEVGTVCLWGLDLRQTHALLKIDPCWPERVLNISALTGALEGAQPLVDLTLALKTKRRTPALEYVLSLASTPWTSSCAVLFELL